MTWVHDQYHALFVSEYFKTLMASHFLLPSVRTERFRKKLIITCLLILDYRCLFFLDFWILEWIRSFHGWIRWALTLRLFVPRTSVLEATVTVIRTPQFDSWSYDWFYSLSVILVMISLWRCRTGLREVDKTILGIIHITWESAILPTICMVIAVGLYHAAPVCTNILYWIQGFLSWPSIDQRMGDHLVLFFVLITGKVYTFGMLRTLNSRAKLRKRMQSHSLCRTSLTSWNRDQAARRHSPQAEVPSKVILHHTPSWLTSSLLNISVWEVSWLHHE